MAQKPIMADSDGQKTVQNCPAFAPPGTNADGRKQRPAIPWAAWRDHTARAMQIATLSGAVQVSSLRMEVTCLLTNANSISQNIPKAASSAALAPMTSMGGPSRLCPTTIEASAERVLPPIQVSNAKPAARHDRTRQGG